MCARRFLCLGCIVGHEKRVRESNFGNRQREIVGDRAPFGGLSERSQGLFRARWGEAKIKICSISFAWGFQGGQFPLDLTQESKNSTNLRILFKLRLHSAFLALESSSGSEVGSGR